MCRILAVRTDSTFSSSAILLLLDEKGLADKAWDRSCSCREMRTVLSGEYRGGTHWQMAVLRKMRLNNINNKNKYNGMFMFVICFSRQKKGHISVHSFLNNIAKNSFCINSLHRRISYHGKQVFKFCVYCFLLWLMSVFVLGLNTGHLLKILQLSPPPPPPCSVVQLSGFPCDASSNDHNNGANWWTVTLYTMTF